MSPISVASIGECMIELSGEDGASWRMGFAGDTFNTAWCLRALLRPDVPVDFVTAFGDDDFSARQRAFFEQNRIGTAASPTFAGSRPGLYAITLDGAERSFTYWRSDSAARRLAQNETALSVSLADRSMIYLSGITLAILEQQDRLRLMRALKSARGNGTLIAFDPNYRPKLWPSRTEARQAIAAMLEVTDIALPTFPDEADLHGDRTPAETTARLTQAGISEIVVKDGTDPALVQHDGTTTTVPAVSVDNPVDTTGAGDSFSGAYLAARCLGDDPAPATVKAHRVAAAVVQVFGALAPFETLKRAFET